MDTITESSMANFMDSHGGLGMLHRFMSIDRNVDEFKACTGRAGVSVGISDAELPRVEALRDAGAEIFCVDVAHAHGQFAGKMVRRIKDMVPEGCIIAGNVATYAGADFLASKGADVIKVGIGGGSVCSTRIKTGFGMPTLSSIIECSRIDRSIIADGGIRTPGDFVKAIAFGADFVMIGGMFAGTQHTPGETFERNGKKFKQYKGMASREAQEGFMGQMAEWKTAEGIAVEVPYREDADEIMRDLRGGLRSGLTYGGAVVVKELQRKVTYTEVSAAGMAESHPHKRTQDNVTVQSRF
jgi:IMP dehydrogenase